MTGEPGRLAATEQAYASIRGDIISGALAPGERLTEQRLAEELGLSRTPVRQAITRLTHEGFVERGRGYDTRVAPFPVDEAEQIFEIRKQLECYAARRAAQNATEEEVAALREVCARTRRFTPPRTEADFEEISRANERFHRLIAEAARSPRLIALLAVAVDVGMVARTYRMYSEADLIRSARHHDELTDAIAAHSPAWAEAVMAAHVLAAATATREMPMARDDAAKESGRA
ncbi:GntR family transcriptional regulator [Pikeienuella piscinae]|uniref:GntR family transcriptional regulator n=1 Tax=Pikeienuella piscinae TaxID=2748098 RepID=A0A7M3T5H0_9RHOB|nr:GntR family transcriptional regulator [Pikeienuella piscinae]QIE57251.1 GntR family transcriptional regulator [Pikeienuella piscinae]